MARSASDDVVKIYDPEGVDVMARRPLLLDIAPGEICMIVGPSGCGKTTLLNAIAGFHAITSGRILLDGKCCAARSKPKAEPGADRIVVFQNGALFPWKTKRRTSPWPAGAERSLSKRDATGEGARDDGRGGPGRVRRTTIRARCPRACARRVEIVRALINEPKVLLLDEPYRALDSLTKSVMHEALLEDVLPQQGHDLLHHPRPRGGDLPRRPRLVLTTRPCRLKKVLNVDIPRPRNYEVLTSEQFRLLFDETKDAVHEEALKAFQLGERS